MATDPTPSNGIRRLTLDGREIGQGLRDFLVSVTPALAPFLDCLVAARRVAFLLDGLDRIPPDNERYADSRVQVAGIYEQDGEIAAARLEVDKAREVEPSQPLDLYAASLQAKAGDVTGAIAFLEGLLAEAPEDAEVLYNIGVIHGEAKNVDEAIRYMRIVLGLNPDHAGALNYVGYTFAERGEKLDEAEAMVARGTW